MNPAEQTIRTLIMCLSICINTNSLNSKNLHLSLTEKGFLLTLHNENTVTVETRRNNC